jgi:hypothetical protein
MLTASTIRWRPGTDNISASMNWRPRNKNGLPRGSPSLGVLGIAPQRGKNRPNNETSVRQTKITIAKWSQIIGILRS